MVETLARRRVVLAVVIAVMVTIGTLFVTYVSLFEPDLVWDELSWNIDEGDSLTYNIVSNVSYFNNNTVIIANVTALPQIWILYPFNSFTSSIIEMSKVDLLYENGSALGSYDDYFRMLLSRVILPCGEWELLDSLFVNPEDAHYGPTTSLAGFVSKLESDYFLLGYVSVDFDSDRGWNAHISLETGLPFYIQTWVNDYSYTTGTFRSNPQTRLELFLVS